MPDSEVYSRKITFTTSNIDHTLVLLLAFDFAKSNVLPLPSRQEQHPVVWKIIKFTKTPNEAMTHSVTYTNRLAFTKTETLPKVGHEERAILSLEPKLVREVNSHQETMLVQDPNKPKIYSFVDPINLGYESSIAMNGVQTGGPIDIAFGFFENKDRSKPAQILSFHNIPAYTPVSLEFVPVLQAYFVPEGFYREGEVLTMPIPSPLAQEIDISSLSQEETDYSIFLVGNRAIIKPTGSL